MKTTVVVGDEPLTVEIRRAADEIEARVGATPYRARVARAGDTWRVTLAGDRTVVATVVRERDQAWVAVDGEIFRCTVQAEGPAATHGGTPRIVAPMPGKVLEVLVAEGQQVSAGDSLVVLEAMKMETVATADAAGTVVRVHVRAGATVESGQPLVELALG